MNEIVFHRTSNVFLNNGIVALYHYLNAYKYHNKTTQLADEHIHMELTSDTLTVKSNALFTVLKEVYYKMGKDLYDTASNKAQEELSNAYYVPEEDVFKRFPAMNTYGLAALITNNAAGKTLNLENTKRKTVLLESGQKDLVDKFEAFFANNKMKLQKQLYFYEPYIKITRLEDFDPKFFKSGKETCYLTGEKFEKLVDVTSTSPFLSGLTNFASHLKDTDKKISWKAMYLSRFSPKYCFYMYVSGFDSLVGYMLDCNDLCALKQFHDIYQGIFRTPQEWLDNNYMSNFKLYSFKSKKKGEETTSEADRDGNKDFAEQFEILFMLIYTVYMKFLYDKTYSEESTLDEGDIDALFGDEGVGRAKSFGLVSFKADKFSNTMRPSSFEYFNQFKFMVRLINHFRKQGLDFSSLMGGLKFLKSSDRNSKNKYRLERQIRNEVFQKILNQKSILPIIENLFYQCYNYLNVEESVGFKDYATMVKLLELYEPITRQHMEKEETLSTLQESAIKLGECIGQSIINFKESDEPNTDVDERGQKVNAKKGRKYIIALHKARNFEQFMEELIRIQTKYKLLISSDLLKKINEDNYLFVKQFAVVSLLNQVNGKLNPKKR